MPNGQAFEDALDIASDAPGLGVGIHLSLVGERCVAPARELGGLATRDELLPASYKQFLFGLTLRRFGARELRSEIRAQVAKVLDSGVKPTHLDSHQHLHVLPGVFRIVLEAAKSAEIGVIRVPIDRAWVFRVPVTPRGAQVTTVSTFSRLCSAKLRRDGIRFAPFFWGMSVSGRMAENALVRTVGRLRPGVNEIMCHPGYSSPETAKRYRWKRGVCG